MKKVHSSEFIVHRILKNLSNYPTIQLTNWRRRRSGVTLVELLIYMSLVSIFIITLTDIFASTLAVRTESETISAVEEDGRFILSRLAYDINRANDVTTPQNLGDTSANLVLDILATPYTYSLSSNNLQLTNNFGTGNLNGSETQISSLSFQKIGNAGGRETVKIQLTLTSKAQRAAGPETKTFTTTVGLR